MAFRRRRLFRLDQLIIGASPEKLKHREIPAAVVPAPLNEAENARLAELNNIGTYTSLLTPAQRYEREQLRQRLNTL